MLDDIENAKGAFGRPHDTLRGADTVSAQLRDTTEWLETQHSVLALQPEWFNDGSASIMPHIEAAKTFEFAVVSATGCGIFEGPKLGQMLDKVQPGDAISRILGASFWAGLNRIVDDYRVFLLALHRANPKLQIILHGFSNAFLKREFWIERALSDAGLVAASDRATARKWIVYHFNRCFAELALERAFHSQLGYVELSDIGQCPEEWHNETHLCADANVLLNFRFSQEIARRSKSDIFSLRPDLAELSNWKHAKRMLPSLKAQTVPALIGEIGTRLDQLSTDQMDLTGMDMNLTVNVPEGFETGVTERAYALGLKRLQTVQNQLADRLCMAGDASVQDVREAFSQGCERSVETALLQWLSTGPIELPWSIATPLTALLSKRWGRKSCEEVIAGWASRIDPVKA